MFAPPDVIVGEVDGFVDLVVRLSTPGLNTVTVRYDTADSTATAGLLQQRLRLHRRRGTLTFAPGETTKVVRVDLLDCVATSRTSSPSRSG